MEVETKYFKNWINIFQWALLFTTYFYLIFQIYFGRKKSICAVCDPSQFVDPDRPDTTSKPNVWPWNAP